MIALLLSATSALAPVSESAVAVQAPSSEETSTLRGLHGEAIGDGENFDLTVGGAFSNPFGAAGQIRPYRRRVYEVTLNNTGTGWQEEFLVGVPKHPLSPAPVVVLFHGYARTPRSIVEETRFFGRAMRRGWYVIAPMGAHKYNFSIDYAQENVQAVLDWTTANIFIDPDRVYGVGFSMGGGMASSFAARHVDPNKLRFAAVVNHTGTVSLLDEYGNVADTSILEHELMFGGSPDEFPFAYSRASVIDLDPLTLSINQQTDLARNLSHVGVWHWSAQNDPLAYLVNQGSQFHNQLLGRGGASTRDLGPQSEHSWTTLDEDTTLDYLEGFTLADPAIGIWHRTLADQDGQYFSFGVTQRVSGSFTPFKWKANAGMNRLFIERTRNLDRIAFDPKHLSLDPGIDLEVILNSLDGFPLTVELEGYSSQPADIQRGGESTANWTYDAVTGRLTLLEYDPSAYRLWRVVP